MKAETRYTGECRIKTVRSVPFKLAQATVLQMLRMSRKRGSPVLVQGFSTSGGGEQIHRIDTIF